MPVRRIVVFLLGAAFIAAPAARGQNRKLDLEITSESQAALDRGLEWLAKNQGPEGNWGSNDLGLVSMGALAFMAAGHAPGRGRYGEVVKKALDYVISNAKSRGLLNKSHSQRDMYNHGLATFVLGQAHGMTTRMKLDKPLDRALKLIADTQCLDGGWDYRAERQARGHDLSLAVMQAKALRSAMDSGLEVKPEVVELAIKSVREHYRPTDPRNPRNSPGRFTYTKGGGHGTVAMAAAGVVCLQEFGEYDDWRIPKNMAFITASIRRIPNSRSRDGRMPFDAYTLYYVGQALYQVGGSDWSDHYGRLRDYLVRSQVRLKQDDKEVGYWRDSGVGLTSHGRVSGKPGQLYATSVACFILAIPNRYLPILQEGRIERWKEKNRGSE